MPGIGDYKSMTNTKTQKRFTKTLGELQAEANRAALEVSQLTVALEKAQARYQAAHQAALRAAGFNETPAFGMSDGEARELAALRASQREG